MPRPKKKACCDSGKDTARQGVLERFRNDPTMETLWDALFLFQGELLHTVKGLEFTYVVKGGELFVSRKNKPITRATVELAYKKALELDGVVTGPKKLGVFGASYLYPVFMRLGIIRQAERGRTLLSVLLEKQIYLDAPCNGNGTCGRCRVRFTEGAPEPCEGERRHLTQKELAEGIRLACMTRPDGDCQVEIIDPAHENMAVLVKSEMPGQQGVAKEKQRTGKNIHTGDGGPSRGCGIAIDIGTTTLAAAIVKLHSGEQLAVKAGVNHQRTFGADVISHIQAANEGKGTLLLECIRSDLNRLIAALLEESHVAAESVKKIAIAGNTTMCHLLMGYSCETLGVAPFTPADISLWRGMVQEVLGASEAPGTAKTPEAPGTAKTPEAPGTAQAAGALQTPETAKAREACETARTAVVPDLDKLQAEVMILPGISAFVGADIVAGIYSSGMVEREEMSMLLDIGTNGEMVIGNREGFLVTSAAAGPVFEGGNISCGVPGIPGAVTHVRLGESPGAVTHVRLEKVSETKQGAYAGYHGSYDTIDDMPPVGLCGTGIIDAVSELVRLRLMDENGTLPEPWFDEGFPVAGENIRISQQDIREIQMGKSAIRAGIETLLRESGADESSMNIYLAGGFGYFMDVDSAINIGLFPESFRGRVIPLGNSSLEGAKRALLTEGAERTLEWIAGNAKEINLAMHPLFNDLYMQYMFFDFPDFAGTEEREK